MRVNKKDKNLLLALKDIQSVEARRHVIDHLGEVPAKRLAAHLKGLIIQQPGYKVRGSVCVCVCKRIYSWRRWLRYRNCYLVIYRSFGSIKIN
jgi:hypothetical protein